MSRGSAEPCRIKFAPYQGRDTVFIGLK